MKKEMKKEKRKKQKEKRKKEKKKKRKEKRKQGKGKIIIFEKISSSALTVHTLGGVWKFTLWVECGRRSIVTALHYALVALTEVQRHKRRVAAKGMGGAVAGDGWRRKV